ncbi:C1 family peptidase [Flavobacterium lacisediminis]|uniref:Aminopeptidase n=1 Tax=Flavobacterium lacisediminis TaxID=2989705 RepID=A0ABT3EKK4_9FLAO|nr:C1 family peptidase [Flavobacterium lacisediminis]MCW1149080.1 aminopeptidase [Flavobacterium lacisediminis]
MKKLYIGLLFASGLFSASAQNYEFQKVNDVECLPVISQDNTGTCWSFSTSSFLESEIIRLTGKKIDLSEMFQARTTYLAKAENYVMRQGKANFSEGALAHDVITSMTKNGLVPNSIFDGLSDGESKHNHAEMVAVLEAMLKTYVSSPSGKLSKNWKQAVNAVLDIYLGSIPTKFEYEGKNYTPKSFAEFTKIKPENYVTLTSFTHEANYKPFILNIPDNFSNGSMYNLPLDEFIANIDNALANGYSLSLDCDVSEPTFSGKYGVAFVPEKEEDTKTGLAEIIIEKNITPEYRQQEFENLSTTDDHLMHIVGKVKDQKGNVYYKVKNSWGSDEKKVANGGYVYMSVPYMKLKAISVMVHKDGISKETKKKLGL